MGVIKEMSYLFLVFFFVRLVFGSFLVILKVRNKIKRVLFSKNW